MAEQSVPVRGVAYTFAVNLTSQADTKLFKAAPTLASGDVTLSKDGGAFANLATLPTVTPAAGRRVAVVLSATEMTADEVHVVFVDAAGAEWADLSVTLYPAARTISDLAFPTVSGRSLDVSAGGEAGIDWANVGSPTTTQALSGTTVGTVTALAVAAANFIADHVMRRTTANVEASANGDTLSARSLYGAAARLVHKVSISGTTMTVTKTDDSTALTTAALTVDAAAIAVTGVDPAA